MGPIHIMLLLYNFPWKCRSGCRRRQYDFLAIVQYYIAFARHFTPKKNHAIPLMIIKCLFIERNILLVRRALHRMPHFTNKKKKVLQDDTDNSIEIPIINQSSIVMNFLVLRKTSRRETKWNQIERGKTKWRRRIHNKKKKRSSFDFLSEKAHIRLKWEPISISGPHSMSVSEFWLPIRFHSVALFRLLFVNSMQLWATIIYPTALWTHWWWWYEWKFVCVWNEPCLVVWAFCGMAWLQTGPSPQHQTVRADIIQCIYTSNVHCTGPEL